MRIRHLRVNCLERFGSSARNKASSSNSVQLSPRGNGGAGDLCQVVDPRSEAVVSSSVEVECGQVDEGAVRRVHELVAEVVGKVGVVLATPGVDQTRDDRVYASIGEAKE